MMRSMFAGVSGLKMHQTRMDTIGNNIANVNTTGFKASRTVFADSVSQTMSGAASPTGSRGGMNPKQVNLGTGIASIDLIFTDGVAQGTGKNTDIALAGNGLFVVQDGTTTKYTRNVRLNLIGTGRSSFQVRVIGCKAGWQERMDRL